MAMEIPTKASGLMENSQQNPVVLVQAKLKEVEFKFKGWLAKQSLPVEAAAVTATSAVQGAAIGSFMGTLTGEGSGLVMLPPNVGRLNPDAISSLKQAQALAGGPLLQARNFAVMTGANAGISCVMKRLRGKDDVQSSMVPAFGSGAVFTLVSGMSGPNPAKFTQPPVEDAFYGKTRSMLSNLGLQNYEKNFKRGLLNDTTLPLLTDSALRDVKIPPGPRLLILDHIERDSDFKDRRRGLR